jgi:hypothetical protein
MKVKFLKIRSIDGVNYSLGEHILDDELAKHWYFLALKQNGDIQVLEAGIKKIEPIVEQVIVTEPVVAEVLKPDIIEEEKPKARKKK